MIKVDELVSVIIPVFNSEQYIGKTLKSVVEQTYQNIEIILINDGSTDDTINILNMFQQQDDRIRVFTQKNSGVSCSRNLGLKRANGEYIVFVDGDDYIENNLIEELLKLITETHSDIGCIGYILNRPDQKFYFYNTKQKKVFNRNEGLKQLISGEYMEPGVWAKIFSRECIKSLSFNKELTYNEDYLFNLMAFSKAKKIAYYDIALYHYVLHPGSATTEAPLVKRALDLTKVAEMAEELLASDKVFAIILKEKKLYNYLGNYNSLLVGKDENVVTCKKFLRDKILFNRKNYRKMKMNLKNSFYYYGIIYFPRFYKFMFLFLKKILPDRRIHKV